MMGWSFIAQPLLSKSIHRSTLEGPAAFSVSTVRKIMLEDADTGTPEMDPEIKETLSRLAALELAENERVTALWNVSTDAKRDQAQQMMDAVPPLTYVVDPRFFDPLTPSIIRRTIETYGYALAPLPKSTINQRGNGGDQRTQLMTVMSLVHHKMLTGEQAAMVLQGAMDLLELQTERKTLEESLRAHFATLDTNL